MSYSEVYSFTRDGYAHFYDEVQNANRGCMAVWQILEEKYLPSLPLPVWWNHNQLGSYYSRTVASSSMMDGPSAMKDVWDLTNAGSPLTEDERIVLLTTFDKVIVKKDMLQRCVAAYEHFEGNTNLKEVAEILKEAIKDPDIIAIGFSISLADGWTDWGDEELDDGGCPYNIFTQKDHWFLGEE